MKFTLNNHTYETLKRKEIIKRLKQVRSVLCDNTSISADLDDLIKTLEMERLFFVLKERLHKKNEENLLSFITEHNEQVKI
jgi:hypothetical protein